MSNKEKYLEEEILIIEDTGGEMPEVALHGSIFFLCGDSEGPRLTLTEEEKLPLKKAVVNRYQTIILRDLQPENRRKSIYRGLRRSAVNWKRMKFFAEREKLEIEHVRSKIARALLAFLKEEVHSVQERGELSCVNCNRDTLQEFAEEIGLSTEELISGWQDLCCNEHEH